MNSLPEGKEIARVPDEIGGDTAMSFLPSHHSGHVAIISQSTSEIITVLPNATEAERLAAYAISPNGGYGSVEIRSSAASPIHETFMDWLG